MESDAMEETPYVGEAAQALALSFEQSLLSLPRDFGVLFASVRALPSPDGTGREVDVVLGVARSMSPLTGSALVSAVAGKEAPDLAVRGVLVFRGSSPSAGGQAIPVDRN